MMHVATVTASLSRRAGGLFESVRRISQVTAKQPGLRVEVLGLADEFTGSDRSSWDPVPVRAFPIVGPALFGLSPQLGRALLTADLDLVHTHGIWMFPSLATRLWSALKRRPYIVSTHGMLDGWALKQSRWKKRAASFVYEGEHLRRASCLRALCASETQSMRLFGLKNPICELPNGVDLPSERAPGPPPFRVPADRRVLLYLGRLHPKKNLIALVRAFSRSRLRARWQLVIVGWDQLGHRAEIERTIGSDDAVQLEGPFFGEEKAACLSAATAFVLPSVSEGLPMAVLEAWASSKPVLMTRACNLPEGFAAGAAIECGMDEPSIERSLDQLSTMSERDLESMGQRGRALVVERFSWDVLGPQFGAVYRWLVHGGTPPACVRW